MTDLLTRTLADRAARATRADDAADVDALLRAVLDTPRRSLPVARLAVTGSVLAVGVTVAGIATFAPRGPHHAPAQRTTGSRQPVAAQRHHSAAPVDIRRIPLGGAVGPGEVRPPADVWLHLNRDGTVLSYGPHGPLHPGDAGYFAGRFAIEWLTREPRGGGDFPLTVQGHPARFTDEGGRPTVTLQLNGGRQVRIIGARGNRVTQQQAVALVETLDLSGL